MSDDVICVEPLNFRSAEKTSPVISVFLGFQAFLVHAVQLLYVPILHLLPVICLLPDDPARGYLISFILLISALSTVLHCFIGVRLPVIATPSRLYISAIAIILSDRHLKCPTTGDLYSMGSSKRLEEYEWRSKEIRGCLLVAAALQGLLALSGVMGFIGKSVPKTTVSSVLIASAIANILRLPDFDNSSLATVLLVLCLVMYLKNVKVPFPIFTPDSVHIVGSIKIFKLFPIIIVVLALCAFHGTTSGLEPNTDDVLRRAIEPFSWASIGTESKKNSSFTDLFDLSLSAKYAPLILPAVVAQNFISIAILLATAHLTGNTLKWRQFTYGFSVEALCCSISALLCIPVVMSPDLTAVGVIAMTNVKRRLVTLAAGFWILIFVIFTKPLLIFTLIPTNIFHGLNAVIQGMVLMTGLGINEILSTRKTMVIGISITIGLVVSKYVQLNVPKSQYLMYELFICTTAVVSVLLDKTTKIYK